MPVLSSHAILFVNSVLYHRLYICTFVTHMFFLNSARVATSKEFTY